MRTSHGLDTERCDIEAKTKRTDISDGKLPTNGPVEIIVIEGVGKLTETSSANENSKPTRRRGASGWSALLMSYGHAALSQDVGGVRCGGDWRSSGGKREGRRGGSDS